MYNYQEVEKKWQKYWDENKTYKTEVSVNKKKFYTLVEFPYPSGAGLHVGHVKGQVAVDVFARHKRMKGYNVLNAMGWDAFGLPAENYAIKNKKHPRDFTKKNIDNFRRQIKKFGPSFDWDREIDTTDPEYYKWTQWIFLKLFEKGLAYEKEAPINWCSSCKTGLANEEVLEGRCERCDSEVEQKNMKQWFLKITDYADKLEKDLEGLDWASHIKASQINWIGRSEGVEIDFKIKEVGEKITTFTTRIDTIFGCTYLVLSPENKLIKKIKDHITNYSEVEKYAEKIKNKTDLERTDLNKNKTGLRLEGLRAVNPFNNEDIDIFIADYVLSSYGTGAVMAVPAHDERDFEFATKYNLPIKKVIKGGDDDLPECFTADGELIDSGDFTKLNSSQAREKMTQAGEGEGFVKRKVNYKLRDWLFSRQRYWGEPIPIIKCDSCGNVPVPEEELPLLLPEIDNYEPSGTGESPLAKIDSWVNVKCPKCNKEAKRETNTMPQWAGSSWYFLRYTDPKNSAEIASYDNLKYFMPVDIYFGGAEHTTVHLLYSRFWNKFLFDQGVVPVSEPYKKRIQHGLILAEDGRKMSKRWENVISPDDIIDKYGADVMRLYIMFMGPYEDTSSWSSSTINGVSRFISKIYSLLEKNINNQESDKETLSLLHKTIKKVNKDIENISFHTAISQMMIFTNHLLTKKDINKDDFNLFIKLLSPFTPHLSEELYHEINPEFKDSVFNLDWPEHNDDLVKDEKVKIAIQVNGKLRDEVEVDFDCEQGIVEKLAQEKESIKKWIDDKNIIKVIFVKNRLINLVVK
jgi:leucyl-tRNA synthetase